MTGVRTRIKRPKFYDYFTLFPETNRTCSHEECEKPAPFITGYYLVGQRRVRVWVCAEHRVGNPITLLPTPPDILAAEEAERQHERNMERRHRFDAAPEKGVSVKSFAPTGHGEKVRYDRVASWRWNGY